MSSFRDQKINKLYYFKTNSSRKSALHSICLAIIVPEKDACLPRERPGFNPRPGQSALVYLCVTKCGNAMSFGWDVKLRLSLCCTPNIDFKDPGSTEQENL